MFPTRPPARPLAGATLVLLLASQAACGVPVARAARGLTGRLFGGAGRDAAGEAAEMTARRAGRGGAVGLVARRGDEAAAALLLHAAVVEPLVARHGAPAARALARLEPRNARRLLMLHEDGLLARSGRAEEVLDVVGRHGDRALEFVWRHKGVLAGGAVLAAFLADPGPYIDGTAGLVGAAGGAAAGPLTQIAGAAVRSRTGLLALVAAGVVLNLGVWRILSRSGVGRDRRRRAGRSDCRASPR